MSPPDPAAPEVLVDAGEIGDLGRRLLETAGATRDHAEIVVGHLVEASRMKVHSHGLSRIPQYLDEIGSGVIDPAAEPSIERSAASRLRVDGRRGFGQVVGMRMVAAIEPVAVETGMAMASGWHLGHTGRVGAYPQALARRGLVGLAACNGAPSGHWVAPFGGRDGRISTNPLAFSWPVDGGPPPVADFSTAMTAEGVVRGWRDKGLSAPPGVLRDADGRPSTDPNVLYADRRGAIQPFGAELAYRGTALALLVEVLTTMLNGDHVADQARRGTDMALVAIRPQPGFPDLARDLEEHMRASPPIDPAHPVMMPGDREHAAAGRGGPIGIPAPAWAALMARARDAGLEAPALIEPPAPTEPSVVDGLNS